MEDYFFGEGRRMIEVRSMKWLVRSW